MNNLQNIVLLIASPKGNSSTSAVLGNYLLNNITETINAEVKIKVFHIHFQLKTYEKKIEMLNEVTKADLIIIASPLYVDTLPAALIKTLSLIKEQRKEENFEQSLALIMNCGFPEAAQNKYAIEICREFARECKINWLGGLALGMGGAISGKSLEKVASMTKSVKKSLDIASDNLIDNEKISQNAIQYMAEPLMKSKFLYTFIGNMSWRISALENKVFLKLKAKPYSSKK